MSLKYYLFRRKNYQNLINSINDIIENYEQISNQYYIHIDAIKKELDSLIFPLYFHF